MKSKRIRDKDVLALKGAIRALDKSTSPKMLKANLLFLWDRYITHPKQSTARDDSQANKPLLKVGEHVLI